MKFEIQQEGVFDVLSMKPLPNEILDGDQLRRTIADLLEKGARHVVLDLGEIDYLYSDAINLLVALNRRAIETGSRLGLLARSDRVLEILLRASLDSMLRIYRSEAEMIAESRDLLRQSSSLRSDPDTSGSLGAANQGLPLVNPPSPRRQLRRRSGGRVEIRSRRLGGRADGQRGNSPGSSISGSRP